MPSGLPNKLALILAGLLIALPSEAIAQRHGGGGYGGGGHGGGGHGGGGYGGGGHGGGGHGGGGYGGGHGYQHGYGGYGGYGGGYAGSYGYGPAYYGYRGYGGYPGYYGYGGYYGHDHDGNGAWIAIGAGILGFVLGSVVSQRQAPPYGYYPGAGPPPPPPPAAPAPAIPRCQDGSPIPVGGYCQGPPPVQQPGGERG